MQSMTMASEKATAIAVETPLKSSIAHRQVEDDGNQDIFHALVPQRIHYRQPDFGAFVVSERKPQHFKHTDFRTDPKWGPHALGQGAEKSVTSKHPLSFRFIRRP